MFFNFIKASPSQNTTVFITSYCPRRDYAEVAEKIMSYEYLYAEQVGFIVPPRNVDSKLSLEMAGGEFCGNAALSAAAYVRYKGICNDEEFFIDVSGESLPIKCFVEEKSQNAYLSKCKMPQVISAEDLEVNLKGKKVSGSVVVLRGIVHFVLEHILEIEDYKEIVNQVKAYFPVEALGVIPYQKLGEKSYEIKPYVYVKKIDSGIFERSCGSGSFALGVHLANKKDITKKLTVKQPGGNIEIHIGEEENSISTEVKFTCEGGIIL